ncbi:D-2-hydroxyacid dehydrogenase [Mumia sp. Pv 4-285]|uniref:D-2-hydroxyacid dehydrogenase n=1 Tax=Mumia qirimensis TaxID=3234852 RepID=UPI00351CFE39
MVNVLISTYLEPEQVDRIAASDPRVKVLYAPELLPVPRYAADHTGARHELDGEQQAAWESLLAQADVAFDFDWQAPEQLSERAPRLRWIQATSAGVGAFMQRTGLHDTDVVVTTAAGIHAVPLAEFAVAGALYFTKGIDELNRRKADKHWERYTTSQLAGRRVTVVGLGGMGRHTVRLFAALGTKLSAVGRPGREYDLPEGVDLFSTDDLDKLLPATDVLVLCTALTPETQGLVDAGRVAALPVGAVVVNISRGQVIDEDALIDALRAGRIAGACLDVFEREPLPDSSPLWDLHNVIVSPHSASTVASENRALTDLFIDNLQRHLDGRPLRNLYRRDLGY